MFIFVDCGLLVWWEFEVVFELLLVIGVVLYCVGLYVSV